MLRIDVEAHMQQSIHDHMLLVIKDNSETKLSNNAMKNLLQVVVSELQGTKIDLEKANTELEKTKNELQRSLALLEVKVDEISADWNIYDVIYDKFSVERPSSIVLRSEMQRKYVEADIKNMICTFDTKMDILFQTKRHYTLVKDVKIKVDASVAVIEKMIPCVVNLDTDEYAAIARDVEKETSYPAVYCQNIAQEAATRINNSHEKLLGHVSEIQKLIELTNYSERFAVIVEKLKFNQIIQVDDGCCMKFDVIKKQQLTNEKCVMEIYGDSLSFYPDHVVPRGMSVKEICIINFFKPFVRSFENLENEWKYVTTLQKLQNKGYILNNIIVVKVRTNIM